MASLAIVFDLIANDKASKDIDKVGDSADKSGGKLAKVGTVAAGLAAGGLAVGGAALVAFGRGAVDAFASVEDATGAAGVTFGKALPQVEKFAEGASKSFGLSKRAALEAANEFGTFGKAAGLQGPELAKFSGELTGLSGDLASFKGTSTEQAIGAVGAALRGEFEPLRAYGVLLDADAIKAEAFGSGLAKRVVDQDKVAEANIKLQLSQEKYSEALKKFGAGSSEAQKAQLELSASQRRLKSATEGTDGALTQQQKTMAIQSLIFKSTGDAQGDYARTSDSTANTQKTLSAEIENAQVRLGEKLAPALTFARQAFLKFIQGASGFIDVVGPALERSLPVVETAFRGIATIVGAIPAPVLIGIGAGIAAIGTALGIASAAASIAAAATAAFNAVLLLNPFVAVAAAVLALGAGLVYAYKKSETFREVVDGAFSAVKDAGQGLADFVTKTIPDAFESVKDAVTGSVDGMRDAAGEAWTAIKDAIPAAWDKIETAVGTALDGIITFIKTFVDAYVTAVQLIWTGIKDAVAAAWGKIQTAVGTAVTGVITHIKSYVQDFVDGVQVIWTAIQNAVAKAWGFIEDAVGTASTGIVDFIKKQPEYYVAAVELVWAAIKDAVPAAWLTIKTAVGTALTGLTTYIREFPDSFVRAVGSLWTAIKNAVPDAFAVIATAIGKAFTGKGGILDKIRDFGGDIVSAIISGIKNSAGDIGGAIKDKIGKIDLNPFGDGPGAGGIALGRDDGQNFQDQPAGVRRLMSLLPAGTPLNSGFRPGARTRGTGRQSYHALGRAVDLPASMELFNYIKSRFQSSTKELIYSPAGNRQVNNGKDYYYGNPKTRADHFSHVHWAMARGGVINEEVRGVGQTTGKSYVFGENGPETVMPGRPDNRLLAAAQQETNRLLIELVRLNTDNRDLFERAVRNRLVGG